MRFMIGLSNARPKSAAVGWLGRRCDPILAPLRWGFFLCTCLKCPPSLDNETYRNDD